MIPNKDIKPEMQVLSLNQKTGKLMPAKIKGLLDMGKKPIYQIETEDSRAIRTTGNHPYLALKHEVRSSQFTDDSQLNLALKRKVRSSQFTEVASLTRKYGVDLESLSADCQISQGVVKTKKSAKMADLEELQSETSSALTSVSRSLADEKNLSSPYLALRQDDSTFSEVGSVSESRLDMFVGQRRERLENILSRSSVFQHIQNLPNHNSSSLEGRLSMADTWVSDDVLIDSNFSYTHSNFTYNSDTNILSSSRWTRVAELSEDNEIAVAKLGPGPGPGPDSFSIAISTAMRKLLE